MNATRLSGLIAAPYTPFHDDFSLNLEVVPRIAEHLIRQKVRGAFVGGTTGEWASLSRDERIALTTAWRKAVGSELTLIVHVGHNCLDDSQKLASHAESVGADCIAAIMPSFFRPRGLADAVDFFRRIAACAPNTPFYYYHIPDMTNVHFDMAEFLPEAAKVIPTFRGIKFTHSNLMDYGLTVSAAKGAFDILYGRDECLLAGLALGAKGAVGSTYNYSATLYHKLIELYSAGRRDEAAAQQVYIQEVILPLIRNGSLATGKAVMGMAGVECGPPRPPLRQLSPEVRAKVKSELDAMDFFAAVKN